MSLWWLWGASSTAVAGTAQSNYPSLWSGGVAWGTAVAGARGYWQSNYSATDRTGEPDISIAVGGVGITTDIRSASWQLGRSEWLSVLQPSTASLEVEGAVTFSVMDEVVISVMADVTDQHSDALWVGYVDDITETNETSGRVTTSVSCVDAVGALGQSPAPASVNDEGLEAVIEYIASEAGVPLDVDDGGTPAVLGGGFITLTRTDDETALAMINRVEQGCCAVVFMQGSGRLRAVFRVPGVYTVRPTPVTIDADAGLSTWATRLSPTSVINDWGDVYDDPDGTTASRAAYGRRVYTPQDFESEQRWFDLVESGVTLAPRILLASALCHVTDLGQAALFLEPLDWVELDGEEYEVLTVSHDVQPGHRWVMTLSGDSSFVQVFDYLYP